MSGYKVRLEFQRQGSALSIASGVIRTEVAAEAQRECRFAEKNVLRKKSDGC